MPSALTKRSASAPARRATGTVRSAHARLQRQRDVLAHRQLGHDAVGLALLGAEPRPWRDRVGGRVEAHRLRRRSRSSPRSRASRPNSSRASSVRPEPSRPAEAEHLAGAQRRCPAGLQLAAPRRGRALASSGRRRRRRGGACVAGALPRASSRPTIAAISACGGELGRRLLADAARRCAAR